MLFHPNPFINNFLRFLENFVQAKARYVILWLLIVNYQLIWVELKGNVYGLIQKALFDQKGCLQSLKGLVSTKFFFY